MGPRPRLPQREWQCRECRQAEDGAAAEGGRNALGQGPGHADGGMTGAGLPRPWAEAWPYMAQHLRHQTQQDRRRRQRARRPSPSPKPIVTVPKAVKAPYRPPPSHAWRRLPSCRKRARQTNIATYAKL